MDDFFIASKQDAEEQYARAEAMLKAISEYIHSEAIENEKVNE